MCLEFTVTVTLKRVQLPSGGGGGVTVQNVELKVKKTRNDNNEEYLKTILNMKSGD